MVFDKCNILEIDAAGAGKDGATEPATAAAATCNVPFSRTGTALAAKDATRRTRTIPGQGPAATPATTATEATGTTLRRQSTRAQGTTAATTPATEATGTTRRIRNIPRTATAASCTIATGRTGTAASTRRATQTRQRRTVGTGATLRHCWITAMQQDATATATAVIASRQDTRSTAATFGLGIADDHTEQAQTSAIQKYRTTQAGTSASATGALLTNATISTPGTAVAHGHAHDLQVATVDEEWTMPIRTTATADMQGVRPGTEYGDVAGNGRQR